MNSVKYAAYFEGLGYYAEKQPEYEWSFTNSIENAKLYVREKSAKERLYHGSSCVTQYGVIGKNKVVSVLVETKTTYSITNEQTMKF